MHDSAAVPGGATKLRFAVRSILRTALGGYRAKAKIRKGGRIASRRPTARRTNALDRGARETPADDAQDSGGLIIQLPRSLTSGKAGGSASILELPVIDRLWDNPYSSRTSRNMAPFGTLTNVIDKLHVSLG